VLARAVGALTWPLFIHHFSRQWQQGSFLSDQNRNLGNAPNGKDIIKKVPMKSYFWNPKKIVQMKQFATHGLMPFRYSNQLNFLRFDLLRK